MDNKPVNALRNLLNQALPGGPYVLLSGQVFERVELARQLRVEPILA